MAFKMKNGGSSFNFGEGTGSPQKSKLKTAAKVAKGVGRFALKRVLFGPVGLAYDAYHAGKYLSKKSNRDKIKNLAKKGAEYVKKKTS
jgi:hypothetical protein|tara:strand:+ start:295 stop:558 length:264 start_codon:yes stop_codon:yes gene_type:complete